MDETINQGKRDWREGAGTTEAEKDTDGCKDDQWIVTPSVSTRSCDLPMSESSTPPESAQKGRCKSNDNPGSPAFLGPAEGREKGHVIDNFGLGHVCF